MTFKKGQIANPKGRPRKMILARQLPQITKLAAALVTEKNIARTVGMAEMT
jgi:hypothetical protein